jgi:hypothetical protein
MNEGQRTSKRLTHRPLLLGIVATLLVIAILIVWAAKRQTAADKLIQQKLAALRASGEPVTGADLAKMFALPPPEQDAMVLFSNAMEFASLNRPPFGLTPIVGSAATPRRGEKLGPQVLSALQTFYADTSSITNLLPKTVSASTRFGTHWEVGVLNANVVPFVKLRSLIQLLGTRALGAAESGDAESASEILAQAFQFARAIPAESTLVEHMIRDACLGLACGVTERCVNQAPFNDRQLTRVMNSIPSPDTNGFANTLRVEHSLAIQVFSEVKAGRRLDEFISGRKMDPWWQRAWKRLRTTRAEYTDRDFIAYLDLIPALQRIAKMPVAAEAIPEFQRLFDDYRTNSTSEVAVAVHPSWTQALSKHYEVEALVSVTKCGLAMERFRLSHGGELPRSVDALVPDFLHSIPRDLFDDQLLRFKPLTNGFAVFSIGPDGVDSGGLEKTNPYARTNYDVTFTIER